MKRYGIVFLFCVFCFAITSLQAQRNYFLAGVKHHGIAFGPINHTNGLRFNLWDRHVQTINGLTVAGKTNSYRVNGVAVGALLAFDSICNGIKLAGISSVSEQMNGLSIGGLGSGGTLLNGVAVGGIVLSAEKINGFGAGCLIISDTMNGFFVAPHGVFSQKDKGRVRGVTLNVFVCRLLELKGLSTGALTDIDEQHGVSIALSNKAKQLHGVQIGLWNVAMNKKHLKKLPLVNFSFRKTARVTDKKNVDVNQVK
nr:hypothetical protein [uncultured Lacibacter sp.]